MIVDCLIFSVKRTKRCLQNGTTSGEELHVLKPRFESRMATERLSPPYRHP